LRREMDGGDSWWMNGNLGAISSNLFLWMYEKRCKERKN
jgi:hypothetical protein